ncbi:MAG: 4-hydroxy-3-methylbut-2-enyl diphosphate reductase [Thermoguttaceae bacterium]|nr:4-hydroxy-3-methylbut-2-enyl diphosphate reductase [Thermoguttaceae bacterium]MDW8039408.1 4-hydroxy-3-methylbut-2-enyl diphosphate reductase [Thermoguttaceae bacterium]
MQIILVQPRGFCAGVRMALQTLEQALERFGPPVYVYHEIVHNRWVVEDFRRRGAVFVEDLAQVPGGAYLILSAHGVSPAVRAEATARGLRVIDATCPLVTKVHQEAIRFAQQGYRILLIGHAGHDEIVGVMGEAPEAIWLIQSAQDVDQLQWPPDTKVAYLTQTTLSKSEVEKIVARLRERFPQIVGPSKDDICYATQNRQEAVRLLAPEVDMALVVGSANSSNSRRLAEIAQAQGVPAYLIDGPQDLRPEWFRGDETVLLTAGASAPEHLVAECLQWLQERFQATVHERIVCQEHIQFPLPAELRRLSKPVK